MDNKDGNSPMINETVAQETQNAPAEPKEVKPKIDVAKLPYAVIVTGGKQYRVRANQLIEVEKMDGKVGDLIEIKDVLVVGNLESGMKIGNPRVENSMVVAEIADFTKAKKVFTVKTKRRKGFRKKIGHRQPLTALKIKQIVA
jgi:large subunit ribosomal protein L21